MRSAKFTISGVEYELISNATIRRTALDMISSASLTLPSRDVGVLSVGGPVSIEYADKVLFHGMILPDWNVAFSSGASTITIPCADLTYRLAHMVVGASVVTYTIGTDIGEIVYSLLDGTGIDRHYINRNTGLLIPGNLDVKIGVMRLTLINYLAAEYGCLFYLQYARVGATVVSYGRFDKYTAVVLEPEFDETVQIVDSSILTLNMSIKQSQSLYCSRLLAIRDDGETHEVGIASHGTAPFFDRVVQVNPGISTPIAEVAADYFAQYQLTSEQMTGMFQGVAINMFNLLDLSQISEVFGPIFAYSAYRVTDLTHNISGSSIVTTLVGVSPALEIWNTDVYKASTNLDSEMQIIQVIDKKIDDEKPEYAEVIA